MDPSDRPGEPDIALDPERVESGESAEERRRQIAADLARTVQESAARRLAEAIAEYDAALDRGALMPELRQLDRDVARAERDHAASRRPAAP